MMADAVKYVVMCNCDDEPGALIIAWIDDERPAGGHIQMRSNTRFAPASSVCAAMRSTAPCTRSVVPHDRRRRVAADATMPGHRGPGTRDSRHTV